MDKKKTLRWLLIAAALLVIALVLRFTVRGSGILPYILGAAALIILIDLFHKNWAVLVGIFAGARLGGVTGMLLALPAMMTGRTLFRVFVQKYENI